MFCQSKKDIENWIKWISQSQPELGGFSICPFAAKSVYKIVESDIDKLNVENNYQVIIFIVNECSLDIINQWVDHYNKQFDDWIFFEDAASYNTFINGLQTNNGKHNLIIAQPKAELMNVRNALKKTSYYSYWSEDYYREIVGD